MFFSKTYFVITEKLNISIKDFLIKLEHFLTIMKT